MDLLPEYTKIIIVMNRRKIAILGFTMLLVSSVALAGILNMTNPTDSGPLGILAVLIAIYVATLGAGMLIAMLGHYTFHLIVPMKVDATLSRRLKYTYRRIIAICAILGLVPIFVISLNSIGQLDFIDVLLIAATEVVALFYVLKKL